MTEVRTALVIGGGIAGPVMALALRKAGIDATVFEAHDGAADGIGAMLTVAPNGLAALQLLDGAHPDRSAGPRAADRPAAEFRRNGSDLGPDGPRGDVLRLRPAGIHGLLGATRRDHPMVQ